jgi:hypothetical protein
VGGRKLSVDRSILKSSDEFGRQGDIELLPLNHLLNIIHRDLDV